VQHVRARVTEGDRLQLGIGQAPSRSRCSVLKAISNDPG
jgi:hypothetical protein